MLVLRRRGIREEPADGGVGDSGGSAEDCARGGYQGRDAASCARGGETAEEQSEYLPAGDRGDSLQAGDREERSAIAPGEIRPGIDTLPAYREGRSEDVAAAGGIRVFAGRSPAASDLVAIYEDVGAVLMTLSTSSVPS